MQHSIFKQNNRFKNICQQILDTSHVTPSGEILVDIDKKGEERPWQEKKERNMKLAEIYAYVDPSKQLRLVDCGKFLEFKLFSDGSKKLHSMTSCRVRLCPICAWRRSLKTFYNNIRIVNYLKEKHNYEFIFLTLTVRNCWGHELKQTLDWLDESVHRMYERPEWKKAVKGACRCVEVTHNLEKDSPWYDSFHPHIHYMIAVNKSYFTSQNYLSFQKWRDLWISCTGIDYIPRMKVNKCYGTSAKAIAECSKYSTKDVEYVIPGEFNLSVKTVDILDKALANRRLLTYTGCFRAAKRILKLEDEENGSLVNVGEDDDEKIELDFVKQTYCWYSGYKQYVSID